MHIYIYRGNIGVIRNHKLPYKFLQTLKCVQIVFYHIYVSEEESWPLFQNIIDLNKYEYDSCLIK